MYNIGYVEMKDRIRHRMADLNMTQAELAEKVGVSQVMVHKLLEGAKTKKIIQLSIALECSPVWLETGKESDDLNNFDTKGMLNKLSLEDQTKVREYVHLLFHARKMTK